MFATDSKMLVHRLAYDGDVVAFKMGGRRRLYFFPKAKRGRFAYITKKQTYRVSPNHPDELWKDWPPSLRY
jgi:hypothetical protein